MKNSNSESAMDGVTEIPGNSPGITKSWTSLKAVKAVCFFLTLALIFITLNRLIAIDVRSNETGISPEVIFDDLSPDEQLFNRYIVMAHYYAVQILDFMSEDSINAGDHIVWNRDYYWNDWDTETHRYILTTPNGSHHYGELEYPDNYPAFRQQMEQNALRSQLNNYRNAVRILRETEGLVYFLHRGTETILSNADSGFVFEEQPIYLISDPDSYFATSHNYSGGRDWTFSYDRGGSLPDANDMTVRLAFTDEFLAEYRSEYSASRTAYFQDFTIIAVSGILVLALLAILLLGAGRKFGTEGVHFSLIDRPFLDISLAAAAAWTALMVYIAYETALFINYRNTLALNFLLAVSTVIIVSPALLWILSLVKRMKAGRFWRHSLIFFIPSKFAFFAMRHAKSLWAGFPLTGKIGLISLASFLIMTTVGTLGYESRYTGAFPMILASVVLTVPVTYLLLRYARRIYKLEQSAKKISCGEYDVTASAGGGELGSIAGSINNISAGINIAVEQRLKSERLKTELITNVSHDIRTPLTSIITYTDLLKNEGLDCENAPEYLDILIQKSQRLKTLTDELFEAAKAATGNIDVNMTKLDIAALINQVLGELDSAIKSSGLDFRVNLPESLTVMADGKLMWRILENMLSNVFKYSLPGSRVYMDTKPEDSAVRIELKNISATELNMDPAELTDRFKRGDDSRADGGSGLGLSIVQSFVTAQGGKFNISIDGDLFKATVYLPLSSKSKNS